MAPSAIALGRWLVLSLWLLKLLSLLLDLPVMPSLMAGLLALCLIVVFPVARPGTRRLAMGLGGIALLANLYDGSWASAVDGLIFASAFPAFLATMALLRAAALVHPMIPVMRSDLGKLRPVDRQSGLMIASHFLGAIITAGTFGILAPLIPTGATEPERRALAIACLRGVNLAVLWSPFFLGMAVVTHYLPQLPVWQIFLQGSLMAGAAYGLILLQGGASSLKGLARALKCLFPLVPPVMVLAALIVVVDEMTELSALQAVFLTVPPIIGVYLLFHSRTAALQVAGNCWNSLALLRDELLLVSVVGLASLSLAGMAGAGQVIEWLLAWDLPDTVLAVLLLLAILLLAMIGVHPMASASLTLALLAQTGPLPDLALAAIGLLGWGLGTMISPGSITVLVASNLFDVLPTRLVFSRNLVFVFGFAVGAMGISASLLGD